MNRTQEKQLDDLVKRFAAEGPKKPETEVTEPAMAPGTEIVRLKPRTVMVLTLLTIAFIYLLVAF